jgi:hypothetical protein
MFALRDRLNRPMQRWTVRNVSAGAIQAVQELAANSGAGLGEVLTKCIEFGIDRAQAQLLANGKVSEPVPSIDGSLDDIFRSIRQLSEASVRARSQ